MKNTYFALFFLVLAPPCFSFEGISGAEQKHSLGIKLGVSELAAGEFTEKDGDGGLFGLSYGYQINPTWTFMASAEAADNTDCMAVCGGGITEPEARFESYTFGIKGYLPVSRNWSLFGKLGASYYKTELASPELGIIKNDGVGALYAVGVDYRLSDKLMFGMESSRLEMDDLDTTNFGISLHYWL